MTFNEIHYHPAVASATEWIELHNQMAVRIDLSGWSIAGGVEFEFAEGAVMEPGDYWVVAANPSSLIVQDGSVVFGSFSGKLSNGGEELLLLDRAGRVIDEIEYETDGKWPCAPDGGGVTLAKRYELLPSSRGLSWTWSSEVGGTPGYSNFPDTILENTIKPGGFTLARNRVRPVAATLVFSEFQVGGDSPFVELKNVGQVAVDLAHYTLSGFSIGTGLLNVGEVVLLDSSVLAKLDWEEGDVLCLYNGETSLVDAVRVESGLRGFDEVRGVWQSPFVATPGEQNSFQFEESVVVNEIHYHDRPIYSDPVNEVEYEDSDLEWLELYNRSDSQIDISGWRIEDAIEYTFPEGSVIAAGGYIVLEGGDYDKSLSNRNDCIQLLDANGNFGDLVEYFDDAPWPKFADGWGSSLELINPDMDNHLASSWKASDESLKAEWKSYSYRGLAKHPQSSNFPDGFHEFFIGLLSSGRVLVDDVSVIEDPDGVALQLIQNGGFESDPVNESPESWRILGNHRESTVVELPEGGKALRIIATGALGHSYNLASTTLAFFSDIDPSKTYEISFRAKWEAGSPQLNTRLYFNRLARTHILPQGADLGSKGAVNTVYEETNYPSLFDLKHSPLVPRVGEEVTVSVSVSSIDGVSTLDLWFKTSDGWASVEMETDGDGSYSAGFFPDEVEGAVAQFYVAVQLTEGDFVFAPKDGPDSRALVRVGDRLGSKDIQTHLARIIMLPEDAEFMHREEHVASDERVPCTFIYDDKEFWYDAGVRLRGSPKSRVSSRFGWNVRFPADRLFRGVHETVAIDGGFVVPAGDGATILSQGAGISTNELIYNQIARRSGGVPNSFDDLVFIEAPRPVDDKFAQLKMARFGDIWKASSYENGDDGGSYKFELTYYPDQTVDGDPESLKSSFQKIRTPEIVNMGPDKEAYRINFQLQDKRSEDDFSPLIELGIALYDDPNYGVETKRILDLDNWLRVMAFQALNSVVDSYNNGLPHNMILYHRPDGKLVWIPWDVDLAYFDDVDTSIFGKANSLFAKVVQLPENLRVYYSNLYDFCQTGFDLDYIEPWIRHYNELSDQDSANRYIDWIRNRREYVLEAIESAYPKTPFRINTNGGYDFSTSSSTVDLVGDAWIDVRYLMLEGSGIELPISWLANGDWKVELPLRAGVNKLFLLAISSTGEVIGSDQIVVENTSGVELPTSLNLTISELMYNPLDPSALEVEKGYLDADDFEYIEILNTGLFAVDLRGLSFSDGVDFDFEASEIGVLESRGTGYIVRSRAAFEQRYGSGFLILGEFSNDTGLSNGGESIVLQGADGGVLHGFEYDDKDPWPEGADGDGYSLELVSPFSNPDLNLAESWGVGALKGGTPGTVALPEFVGVATDDNDGDGMPDFLNYLFGGRGADYAPRIDTVDGCLVLVYRNRLGIDESRFEFLYSTDLKEWKPFTGIFRSSALLGNGVAELGYLLAEESEGGFIKLKAMPLEN